MYVQNHRHGLLAHKNIFASLHICLLGVPPNTRFKRQKGKGEKIKMTTNRGKRKEIAFKEDEWAIVEEKAKELNIDTTKYIKRMALNGYIITYNLEKINDLIYEINKVGVNINQVVRKANEIDNIYKDDIEKLEEKLNQIYRILGEYIK